MRGARLFNAGATCLVRGGGAHMAGEKEQRRKGEKGTSRSVGRSKVASSPLPLFPSSSPRHSTRTAPQPRPRAGLTLLEVLIALAIFLVAMTAIGQLIALGSRASVEARLEADAVLRAESALNEVLAGIQPMQTTQATAFEDDADWQWSLTVSEGPHVDLVRVDVSAFYQPPGEEATGTVTLSRLVRNPDLFLEAALAAEE